MSMSRSDNDRSAPRRPGGQRAVALQYGVSDSAPVIVASGMGHLAEKMLEVAQENGVPVYEDNSLATILSQLNLGQEIPEELYRAVVEIYVYFLNFDFDKQGHRQGRGANRSAPVQDISQQPAESAGPSQNPPQGPDGSPSG